MKPNLIIDFDGVIVDPAPRDFAVYRDVLTSMGCNHLHFDRYWELRRAMIPIAGILRLTVPNVQELFSSFIEGRDRLTEDPTYLALDTLLPNVAATLERCSDAVGAEARASQQAGQEVASSHDP